jgi:hypothetical protein
MIFEFQSAFNNCGNFSVGFSTSPAKVHSEIRLRSKEFFGSYKALFMGINVATKNRANLRPIDWRWR